MLIGHTWLLVSESLDETREAVQVHPLRPDVREEPKPGTAHPGPCAESEKASVCPM